MKKFIVGIFVVLMLAFSGCHSGSVITHTGTVLGAELDYKPETNFPYGRLGYCRSELSVVPTNKTEEGKIKGGGAKDVPNVLIEFSMANIFNIFTRHLIYQRVAVGDIAVTQPGAVAMLVKDGEGKIDPEVLKVALAVSKIPVTPETTLKAKNDLKDLYLADATVRDRIIELLKARGIDGWDAFIDDKTLTADDINSIIRGVRNDL